MDSEKAKSGKIEPFHANNISRNSKYPLTCTHIVKGHSRAILSMVATNDVLFTSSQDRTVKIWDLKTGVEIQSSKRHPNDVVAVKYNEYTRLIFSVSNHFIKIWDVRENPRNCVKILCSSGLVNSASDVTTSLRSDQIPAGETQIQDIALKQDGNTLFSAADSIVRIWDLNMFKPVGRLNGRGSSRIMCLAVDNSDPKINVVVIGSKDHSIKIFNVPEGGVGLHSAKKQLTPLHYDGIQSLALNKDTLFSGSRDMNIKKWNLKNYVATESLTPVHKDWINALAFFNENSVLLSGCKNGYLQLWSAGTSKSIGEVRAHSSSINAIATNGSCIFTGSSDCSVGIWSMKNHLPIEENGYKC